ncbi:MAG: helix-turn-helix transcriptional regulator [Planctomycetes bacterium]|nr:helix-turn-helix transcriptional regulator [Planctomycetota bacterium]
MAERLAVSANYVSMVERGRREPTLKYLRQFAAAVNVPLSFVFWEPDSRERTEEQRNLHHELDVMIQRYASSSGVNDKE